MNSGLISGLAAAPLRTPLARRTGGPGIVVGGGRATGVGSFVAGSGTASGAGSFSVNGGIASGAGASAFSSTAAGTNSIASGTASTASGANSVAMGSGCSSSGTTSVALGASCSATGSNCASIGSSCTASGNTTIAIGLQSTASNSGSVSLGGSFSSSSGGSSLAIGSSCTASGVGSIAGNLSCTASGNGAVALGNRAIADRSGMLSHGSGFFVAIGDSQSVEFVARNKTTNATPTTLFLDGTTATDKLTIPSGKILSFIVHVIGIKSDGTAVAKYIREGTIKNVAGTVSLVGSIITLGTDHEDNADTDIAITADDTNDALQINVTGIASETWRWTAVVQGVEIAYGT